MVLVKKALIVAYKATNKTNRIKLETLLFIFHPLICKVLSELEQNMLPFTFA